MTFNHGDVMEAVSCIPFAELPIREGRDAFHINRACKEFLLSLLASGKDIFSIRFDTTLYNTCHGKSPLQTNVQQTTGAEMKRDLTFAEAAGLASAPTYLDKLELLRARKGYSNNLDESFTGKNLINVLAGLGRERSRFAAHATHSKADHPDGPGARAFYDLFVDLGGSKETRAVILRHCRALWPTDVTVDGAMRTDMHLGWPPGGRRSDCPILGMRLRTVLQLHDHRQHPMASETFWCMLFRSLLWPNDRRPCLMAQC